MLSSIISSHAPCARSQLMNVQLGGQLPLDASLWSELRSLQVGHGPQQHNNSLQGFGCCVW